MDPAFVAEFYKNLKILSQDLYKRSAVGNAASAPVASVASSMAMPSEKRTLLRGSSFGTVEDGMPAGIMAGFGASGAGGGRANLGGSNRAPLSGVVGGLDSMSLSDRDYFSPESMQERMQMYLREGGIPSEFIERYSNEVKKMRRTESGEGFLLSKVA